jgi:hypothetical protein
MITFCYGSMMANYWKLFKRAKDFYFGLGKIKCPAFNDEEIIFDQRGFNHFLLKSKGKRPIPDQIRRFKLLFGMRDFIQHAELAKSTEEHDIVNKTTLQALLYSGNDKRINIVVPKNALGNRYFISIMDKE